MENQKQRTLRGDDKVRKGPRKLAKIGVIELILRKIGATITDRE